MPTYDYRCTGCGHEFEIYQSFSDATLTECPECSGALRKVLHPVGVVFKGSGFYRTDSRDAGKGTTAKGESSSSGTTDKGTGTTAKPESSSGTSSSSGSGSSGGAGSGSGSSGSGSSGSGSSTSGSSSSGSTTATKPAAAS